MKNNLHRVHIWQLTDTLRLSNWNLVKISWTASFCPAWTRTGDCHHCPAFSVHYKGLVSSNLLEWLNHIFFSFLYCGLWKEEHTGSSQCAVLKQATGALGQWPHRYQISNNLCKANIKCTASKFVGLVNLLLFFSSSKQLHIPFLLSYDFYCSAHSLSRTLAHKRAHANLISGNGESGREHDKWNKTTVCALLGTA